MSPLDNEALRQILENRLDQLMNQVSSLNQSLSSLQSGLNSLSLSSSTQIVELRAKVQNLEQATNTLHSELKSVDDSQKFKWTTLSEERKKEAQAREQKELEQAKLNNTNIMIARLLWAILIVWLGILLPFIWAIMTGRIKLTFF